MFNFFKKSNIQETVILEMENNYEKGRTETIEQKDKTYGKHLLELNELLSYMTNLDYVKEMIKDIEEEVSLISGVASTGNELSVSATSIAQYTQESSGKTNDIIDNCGTNLENIDKVFQVIKSNIKETQEIKSIINQVSVETKEINNVVQIIRNVANQTNLLSLNASIEAARAGQEGKGFGVVAEEIKKLASNTKEQVEYIQGIVNSLNEKISIADNSINKLNSTFENSVKLMEESNQKITGMSNSLNLIGDSFSEISATIEEQTSALEVMATNIDIIDEKAIKVHREVRRTGEAFYNISKAINTIRIGMLTENSNLSKEAMVKLCITDHLIWKWEVYNMLLGNCKINTNTIGTHNECRLGKWINSIDSNNNKVATIIKDIERPHSAIHNLAKNAVTEFEKKNIKATEGLLVEIERNSIIVVDLLKSLANYL